MSHRSAQETIELFWQIQNDGDYTQVVKLFAETAGLVDPVFGVFEGRAAIAEFMAKMNIEMQSRQTTFKAIEIAGGGDTAWAQWLAETPTGTIEGCGLYRVEEGLLTYYKDYMNPPSSA